MKKLKLTKRQEKAWETYNKTYNKLTANGNKKYFGKKYSKAEFLRKYQQLKEAGQQENLARDVARSQRYFDYKKQRGLEKTLKKNGIQELTKEYDITTATGRQQILIDYVEAMNPKYYDFKERWDDFTAAEKAEIRAIIKGGSSNSANKLPGFGSSNSLGYDFDYSEHYWEKDRGY